MTVKEYLGQYRYLNARIDAKLEQIMRLRALVERRTAVMSDMPKGKQQKDWTDVSVKIIMAERELDAEIDRLLALKTEIEVVIAAVLDDIFRTLLEQRYVPFADEAQSVEAIEGPGGAIDRYLEWQMSRIGRAINPDYLLMLLVTSGALKVDITSPVHVDLSNIEVAKLKVKNVSHQTINIDER